MILAKTASIARTFSPVFLIDDKNQTGPERALAASLPFFRFDALS